MTRQPSRPLLAALLATVLVARSATSALSLTWGPVVAFGDWGSSESFPGAAVTANGWIHTVYDEFVIDKVVVVYRRSKDGGQTWGPPFLFGGRGQPSKHPAVATTGSVVHLVWVESEYRLRYRRSADSGVTWTAPKTLGFASGDGPRFPRIAADAAGHVLVTWTDAAAGQVVERMSSDGGLAFGTASNIGPVFNQPFGKLDAFPVPVLGTGFAAVIFEPSASTLKVRRTTNWGTSWLAEATLATDANGLWPGAVAVGNTVIVGYARVKTPNQTWTVVERSTDKGATWSAPIALSAQTSPPSFEPVLGYGNGKWRAIFERCTTTACTSSRLLYRESTNGTTWSTTDTVSTGVDVFAAPSAAVVAGRTAVFYVGFDSGGVPTAHVRSAP